MKLSTKELTRIRSIIANFTHARVMDMREGDKYTVEAVIYDLIYWPYAAHDEFNILEAAKLLNICDIMDNNLSMPFVKRIAAAIVKNNKV